MPEIPDKATDNQVQIIPLPDKQNINNEKDTIINPA